MKLSLAWIFDHIDADWKKQDVQNIMRLFNQTTAEIECFYEVNFDLSHFFLAVPKSAGSFSIPELGKEIEMKGHSDAMWFDTIASQSLTTNGISTPSSRVRAKRVYRGIMFLPS